MTNEQLQLAIYRLIVGPNQYYELWDTFIAKYGKTPEDWVREKVESGELILP